MAIPTGSIIIDKTLAVPVYLQVSNAIINFIRQGILKPGSQLPSSRALANDLQVHRQTIVAAYDELDAQSWIGIFPKKGAFVSKHLPDVSPRRLAAAIQKHALPATTGFPVPDKIKVAHLFENAAAGKLVFNDGFPDTRIAPVELMIREYRRFANYRFTPSYLMYGPEQGSKHLRQALAQFLSATRGLNVTADDILITKGVQMALYLTAQVLLSQNDIVIVGEPGYSGANEVFEQAGARLELVPVDEHGLDIQAVEAICRTKKVKMLYVIPHHHTPTTVTLSSDRRVRLLELAKKYKFAIIEDDYDFDFHYSSSPILPLASVDHCGNVIYIGSFCKTIAPGIRIGFMIAPGNFLLQAIRLRKLIDRQGEQLLEEAMANLLDNGDIGRHLKKANKLYRERRDMLCRLLSEQLDGYVSFRVPDGGFAVWITYLPGTDPSKVAQKAAELGLILSHGKDYYHDRSTRNSSIRLGFASLNAKEMEAAVVLLGKAIRAVAGK